ncbi:MAG TPA: hypothetical protein RMG45_07665, partial [Polyangiaceae bacterium LLY-WYZ-15_(1-7)]|nr:hypothetical protein [Polyangiaceae bacterium LLY-WYZ-15_(1-7)]
MRTATRSLLLLMLACSSAPEAPSASSKQALQPDEVAPRDLAVILPLIDDAPVHAEASLGTAGRALPESWYRAVERAFDGTDAEDALQHENRYGDWRLVSFRVAPCSPLQPALGPDTEALCWPEVRLVWQPVLEDERIHARFSPAFADDRAIHALYDVAPERTADAETAARVRAWIARLREGGRLTSAERATFVAQRDAAARALVEAAVALR